MGFGYRDGRRRSLAGLLLAALSILFAAAPGVASARWIKAESARFIVYSAGSERDARAYARKLEDFDDLLRAFHGLKTGEVPPRKFEVYLVGSLGQMKRVVPESTMTSGGYYMTDVNGIYAIARTDLNAEDIIVFHEYTHHFMYQNFPYGYPGWMVEGYAEYFGATHIDDEIIDVGRVPAERAYELVNNTPIDIKSLLTKQPMDFKGTQRLTFYAQAWRLAHYMLSDDERRKQIDTYLRAVGAGGDVLSEMEKATGLKLADLDARLRAYRKVSYMHMRRKPAADAEVKVTPLPPSADDLLLESLRIEQGVAEADRPALLEKIRAAASKYPDDRFAQLTLARAETTYGDRGIGEAILKTVLAANPDDAEALMLMGESRIRAGDADLEHRAQFYKEARPWLGKAYKQDKTSYETLFAFAQSKYIDQDFPSENTLNTLLEARTLAPQVPEIAIATADALIRRHHEKEARSILTPMANDPHHPASAAAARKLLDQIREPETKDAAPAK